MDNRDDECTICLESFNGSTAIGVIQTCRHYYHDHCILQWSNNSNSCPTCRKLYYRIEIKRKEIPQLTYKVIGVKDKLLSNDAINDIPQEFIIPANEVPNNATSQSSSNGLCIICSSSDYRSSFRDMAMCNFCSSNFHLNCLGLTGNEGEISWCCPICDCSQDLTIPANNISGVPRGIRRRSSIASRNAQMTESAFRGHGLSARLVRPSSLNYEIQSNSIRRPGLVIHNENNEIDDDFLYDDEESVNNETKPIINGGVILRKELKIEQNLTKEEAKSWELFNEARNNSSITNDIECISSNEPKKRRRKKITPVSEPPLPSSSNDINKGSSRISTLISQFKASTDTHANLPSSSCSSQQVAADDSLASLCGHSPADSDCESDSKGKKKSKLGKLSLEQKNKIQKHIRNKLRPIYKPSNSINESSKSVIKTEENYISINKTISRKIYNYILSSSTENGELKFSLVNQFFGNNETKLKEITERYINDELKNYKL